MDNDQLNRIESKIDGLDKRIGNLEVIAAVQHSTLEEHTSRSTKLENIVMPIKSDIDKFKGALQFIGLLGIAAGILDVIIRLFHH